MRGRINCSTQKGYRYLLVLLPPDICTNNLHVQICY